MVHGTAIGIVVVIACSSLALAQPLPLPLPLPLPMDTQGTPEDRAACSADVHRFCENAIPDSMRILSCLQTNRQRISPACRGVLQKYGQ